MSELTETQKENLLDRATKVAQLCYDEWDWDIKGAVQGGIDDTADERATYAEFEGEREVAYDYLDSQRKQIARELADKVEFTIAVEVRDQMYQDEDVDIEHMSDDDLIEYALETIDTAPMFDGIDANVLERLSIASVERYS